MMNIERKTMRIGAGRTLEYVECGAQDGKPVFFLHGGGTGSNVLAYTLGAVASQLRIRLIAPNRPGIGLSDFQPQRTIADWSKDLSELANYLQLPTFALLSHSAGSAYALACAHDIPDRISRLAIVSGIYPLPPAVAKKEIPFQGRIPLSLFRAAPAWLLTLMFKQMERTIRRNPEKFFSSAAKRAIPVEKSIMLSPEYQATFIKMVATAFQQGVRGAVTDIQCCFRPGGFQVHAIAGDIQIWHGEADQSAPVAMATYLRQSLSHSQIAYFPQEGHIAVLQLHKEEILKNLVS